jgi:outer membrane protein TolC
MGNRRRGVQVRIWALSAAVVWSLPGTAAAQATQAADSASFPLVAAVRRALVTHPSVGMTEAQVAGSDALVAAARSARLPRLSVNVNGTRFEQPMIVAPLHGLDLMRPPRFDETLLQGRLEAGYTLFDGGARGARIDRALANAGSASATDAVARGALIERAVRAYLRVRSGREVVAAHAAQVSSLESERDRAERMFSAGRVARVAVLRAEAALSRARAAQSSAVGSLREAEGDLARLTDTTVTALEGSRLESAAPGANLLQPERPRLIEAASSSSPSVERARLRLRAAEAGHREAVASYWPTLSLAGGYVAYASASDAAVTEWQAALQMAWPVFTGGARQAAAARAASEATAASAAVRMAELDVAAEVDRAVTALEEAQAREASLAAAETQFEEVVQVESLALETGAGVQTDYLRAVSDLLETRAALTGARSAVVGAHVTLARLTGELTVEWLERMVEVGQ